MNFSDFGNKFTANSGILELMDDLGKAMATSDSNVSMFGGGNPAHIPGLQALFRKEIEAILQEENIFENLIGNYDTPQGNRKFIESLVSYLNDTYGWGLTPENIAITSGSQTGFFMLFNLLAGPGPTGNGKILFPLTPEYIGYADQGIHPNMFTALKPIVEETGEHEFKYKIDFDNLSITPDIKAICVSRPTNPSGNVITDEEVAKLANLAKKHKIPLIIDNAYGQPFPGAIFTQTNLHWDEDIILSMSLSKVGLPGLRVGIFIAKPEIASALSKTNAIMSLSSPGFGQALVSRMLADHSINEVCSQYIKPYYQDKAEYAQKVIAREFGDLTYALHKHEGSFFFWLWLRDLPITTKELYMRLKEKGVIVVPGEYFFPGLENAEKWEHTRQCLRLNFARPQAEIDRGFKLMAEELKQIYSTAA